MNTSLTGRVEAVQRKALNVVDWRFRSPTSSEHPYRSFAKHAAGVPSLACARPAPIFTPL